jgi:hypothetical protein
MSIAKFIIHIVCIDGSVFKIKDVESVTHSDDEHIMFVQRDGKCANIVNLNATTIVSFEDINYDDDLIVEEKQVYDH